jgi:inosose dehydratase
MAMSNGEISADQTAGDFQFAAAPVSWGVEDYQGPSWEQPFSKILDEMSECGYTGTELGPYGYLPTEAETLQSALRARSLAMLSSFVPVSLADPARIAETTRAIRDVGKLLSALGAPCIVLADAQSTERENVAGRVAAGAPALTSEQWRNVARIAGEAERIAGEFGLDLVFHPHVATFVETPLETERFFDAVSASSIGLCLDTGHCYYGGGDPVAIAKQYREILRYVHIKDIDPAVLADSNRKKLNFDQAITAGVFSQIGEGRIDFLSFFQTLLQNGYRGWCVVEQDIKYGVSTVSPKQSMSASLQYLHGIVARLQDGDSVKLADKSQLTETAARKNK